MLVAWAVVALALIVGAIVLFRRSHAFRVFLAGAFFVSAGIQYYLAWVGVSIPLAGTRLVQTPAVGWTRATLHAVLCIVCCYFGFWYKSRARVR